jgi:hypothetical protein
MTFRPATRCGQPAHLAFTGRVTASLIAEHGSYDAARAFLAASGNTPPPAQPASGLVRGAGSQHGDAQ